LCLAQFSSTWRQSSAEQIPSDARRAAAEETVRRRQKVVATTRAEAVLDLPDPGISLGAADGGIELGFTLEPAQDRIDRAPGRALACWRSASRLSRMIAAS
jgi:hypothetical protein